MQVRNAIVAVTVAAFALTLSACTTGTPADPTGGAATPAATPTATTPAATPAPTATADATKPAGEIRPIQDGFHLANVADTLRGGFPSFADKTDDEIVVILNAGCDALDKNPNPQAGADAIQAYGIDVYDAAFSLTASIQLYCPEYVSFLGGKG